MGLNKWESIQQLPMARCDELAGGAGGDGDWWRGELALPALLCRVDFVTMDSNSGAVDNNGCAGAGQGSGGEFAINHACNCSRQRAAAADGLQQRTRHVPGHATSHL